MTYYKVSIQEVYGEPGQQRVSEVVKQSTNHQSLGEILAEAIAGCSVRDKYLLVADVINELDAQGLMIPFGSDDDTVYVRASELCNAADGLIQACECDEEEEVPEGTILPLPVEVPA